MTALLNVLQWFTKLVYLNVLAVLFILLGLGLFGFFPALIATFFVMYRWINKKVDVAIFQSFWHAYKTYFIKSNVLGYLLGGTGVVLYIDLYVMNSSQYVILHYLSIPLLVLVFLYSLMLFYVFPTLLYVEDESILNVLKTAFLTMVINPLPTIFMVAGSFGLGYILFMFQALMSIVSMSLFAFVVMMPAHHAFLMIQRKKGTLSETERKEVKNREAFSRE
ncbi:YesL family protein [Alkalihalobacillus hemicellulosilyticus]|uniref:DUF624 domain-containing protein n=1 Tax=Halalkalibacter hemicellulosilyticusJCM 9152 TaxID=1236971 RepID=W4QKM1_9BACI|nr:DUF624 domain-containing protein [Halalkalibacter hemicellulosilyticus]GAE32641.1 hypothetical protein JCM9152_4185 [Halalkalibacter hemicellulosilyticusJCM 9152]